MTTDHPAAESPREHLAREATDTYAELTERAGELPPEGASAARSVRDVLTDTAANYAALDRRMEEQERFTDILLGDDVGLLAALLRNRLTQEKRADLARRLSEP